MTMLSRASALWRTVLLNRDWPRYVRARFLDAGDDRELTFRLRNGQTVVVPGSIRSALNEVYLHKVYDIPRVDFRQCRHVFDFGANAGIFALYVAARAPAAQIACFEPSAANLAILQRNLGANGVRAQAWRMAVSTDCEPRPLSLDGGSGQYKLGGGGTHFESVPCTDLAGTFKLARAKTCDFLKMDIEGEEMALLLKAPLADLRRVRAMALEWHYPERQLEAVRARLATAGFELSVERVGHARQQVMLKAWQR